MNIKSTSPKQSFVYRRPSDESWRVNGKEFDSTPQLVEHFRKTPVPDRNYTTYAYKDKAEIEAKEKNYTVAHNILHHRNSCSEPSSQRATIEFIGIND